MPKRRSRNRLLTLRKPNISPKKITRTSRSNLIWTSKTNRPETIRKRPGKKKRDRNSRRKWRWTTQREQSRLNGLGSRLWARTWLRSGRAKARERKARRSDALVF